MLNHISIMGRLTRDPEMHQTGSGVSVANFTLAVERDYKNGQGEREADFIDVVAWRGSADFAVKYFRRGSMAAVSGRLQIRNWTDKDGNKRSAAEVVAESIYFADSKKDTQNASDAPVAQSQMAPIIPLGDDDDDGGLPF